MGIRDIIVSSIILLVINNYLKDDFNIIAKNIIDKYKLPKYHPISKQFKDCFPLSDYNDTIDKLFNINYLKREIKHTPFNSIILNELFKINNYTYIYQNDNDNDNNIYYDNNYNELRMNSNIEYYDYLYNKYIEFDNNYNKYNFIENVKYHFNMKNEYNKYIHKIPFTLINNINDNDNDNGNDKKRCILNSKINIKNNDFNFEYSLIAINKKDYENNKLLYNLNRSYYITNLLSNYYHNLCNSNKKLCGNLKNYNIEYLYYYPYFNAYNVNVFNYIFNRIYKSFVNFDIEEMINNVPNITEMTNNILIGIPVANENIKLIYQMFP